MSEEQLLIQELAERCGVSIRNIRYYISEGLLPSPQVRGRYTLYTSDYIYRLKLIQRLKDAHLPLKEIRHQMNVLPAERIRELAEQDHFGIQELELSSAVFDPGQETVDVEAQNSAVEYISRVLEAHNIHERQVPPGPVPQIMAARRASSIPRTAPQPAIALQAVPVENSNPTVGKSIQPDEKWRRISLAEGIELHLREPLPADLQKRVQKLLDFIQNLF
jgi:DNA-binding transcriptional MerR regulator